MFDRRQRPTVIYSPHVSWLSFNVSAICVSFALALGLLVFSGKIRRKPMFPAWRAGEEIVVGTHVDLSGVEAMGTAVRNGLTMAIEEANKAAHQPAQRKAYRPRRCYDPQRPWMRPGL